MNILWRCTGRAMTRLHMACVALAATATFIAPPPDAAQEARTPDASIVVSSSGTESVLGSTPVQGTLHHRDKVYLLTLRGAQPAGASNAKVYNLREARNIGGAYRPIGGELRNDRGVAIVFDPPLSLPGGRLQIELNSRVHPKASTGQRGTID